MKTWHRDLVFQKLEYHDVVNTGNRLVDALLSQKIREARMHGINIVTKVLDLIKRRVLRWQNGVVK
jgi:hypothetical protein